jgi:hypothetical protein
MYKELKASPFDSSGHTPVLVGIRIFLSFVIFFISILCSNCVVFYLGFDFFFYCLKFLVNGIFQLFKNGI